MHEKNKILKEENKGIADVSIPISGVSNDIESEPESRFEKYTAEYLDYLEDIRKRIYRLVVIFCVVLAIGFFGTAPLLKFFVHFFAIKDVTITTTSPFQLLDLAMDIGMFFAIIVTAPLFIYNVYSFLKPGLLPKERRFFIILIPIGLLLFVTGFLYGFVALYYSLALIASINVGIGVVNLWDIRYFVSSMFITSALLGIVFQFPIILTFLVRMGVMNIDYMKKKRYEAFIMIFAFVSLLPPTDGLSLIIMSVPLVAMYEFIILFNTRRDTLT